MGTCVKLGAAFVGVLALTGCGSDALDTADAQKQLDATFEQIDAIPLYDQNIPALAQWAKDDGACAVSYASGDEVVIGVEYANYPLGNSEYDTRISIDRATRVDCHDLQAAYTAAVRTLALEDVSSHLAESASIEQVIKTLREADKNALVAAVRDHSGDITKIGMAPR